MKMIHVCGKREWRIHTSSERLEQVESLKLVKCIGREGGSAPTKSVGKICHFQNNVLFRDVFPRFLPEKPMNKTLKLFSISFELVGRCFRNT